MKVIAFNYKHTDISISSDAVRKPNWNISMNTNSSYLSEVLYRQYIYDKHLLSKQSAMCSKRSDRRSLDYMSNLDEYNRQMENDSILLSSKGDELYVAIILDQNWTYQCRIWMSNCKYMSSVIRVDNLLLEESNNMDDYINEAVRRTLAMKGYVQETDLYDDILSMYVFYQ